MARTKENEHLSPYYQNKSVRNYIDRRVKIIQEQLNPYLSASDYKEGDDEDLEQMKEQFEQEIKDKDPVYYDSIDLYKD